MSSRTEALEFLDLEMDLEDDLEIYLEGLSNFELEAFLDDLGFLEFLRGSQNLALDTKISENETSR